MTSSEARSAPRAGGRRGQARRDGQVREIEQRAREEGEERARKIVTIAIQRVASEQTAESTVVGVRAAERGHEGPHHRPRGPEHPRVRGDDRREPDHRRHARGRGALAASTPFGARPPGSRSRSSSQDGRIHPARIEEIARALAAGDRRADPARGRGRGGSRSGITDIHPEMIKLLGRLQFRTSYGQNVLKHLVESAHIAAAIAAELGHRPDDRQARRVPARHRQGRHPRGRGLARDHRRRDRAPDEGVARGRPLHRVAPRRGRAAHDRRGARADRRRDQRRPARGPARVASRPTSSASSGSRRSARATRASRRSTRCRPAGRSASWSSPRTIDDLPAQVIARDIAKQVEEELQYPGQIKITVVRETRSIEYAR